MCEAKRELIKQKWREIEKIMQEKSLTIYQLAKKADVNHSTLYSWSNGDYMPKPDKLEKVCNALGLNYKDFL